MSFKNFLKGIVIAFSVVFLLMAGLSYSQESTGKLRGAVKDGEGAPLPGVTVEISSLSLMGIRADVTTGKGLYRYMSLNPGTYKVVFRLEGFQTVEISNVVVSVGGTTTADAKLEMTTLEEEVVVVGEAPVIDVEKSGLSSRFRAEDLETLPLPRTRFGISSSLQMHSGFNDYNAFGSDGTQNSFNLDGLAASSPEGGSLRMTPDVDVIEEIEMLTVGAPAEYGQMAGAVVNIVKKYGQNELEAMLGVYIKPDFLVSDNNPDPDNWQSLEHIKFYDASASISGAIAKDRIWFFAYANKYRENVIGWRGNPLYPLDRLKMSFELKVTGQIGTRHKISGNLMYIYYDYPTPPSDFITTQAADISYFSKPGYFFNWDWQVSRNALFSSKAGIWLNPERGGEVWPGVGASLFIAPHYDEETDILSQAPDRFNWWQNAKFALNNYLSYFAEDFLGGGHDFKVGVQFSRGVSHVAKGWPGNAYYFDRNNQPYRMYSKYPHHYGGYVTSLGVFADDTMKVGDRLTLNFGARFDHVDADIPEWPLMNGPADVPGTSAPGAKDIIIWDHFSPRFGFTYQLTPDHKTILKGHWGIYHYGAVADAFGIPGPGKRDLFKYEYTGPPTTAFPYATNPFDDPDNWNLYDEILGAAGFTMDPNLKNPTSSQATLGIEREVISNVSVGLTYVFKKEWNQVGLEDRGATYEQVQRTSPDNGKTYTVYNLVSGEAHNIWQVNPESFRFRYHSVMLEVNKKYSDNWMLKSSLQWQRGRGLNNGFNWGGGEQSMWENDFGQDPNDLINADGYIPFVREWIFKTQAAYTFPFGFSIGVAYRYDRGEYHRTTVQILGLNQGLRYIVDEPLGNRRLPDEHRLDMRLEKVFNFNAVRFHLIADIANVFNNRIITRYSSYWLASSSYMALRSINTPRVVQIGLKLTF